MPLWERVSYSGIFESKFGISINKKFVVLSAI